MKYLVISLTILAFGCKPEIQREYMMEPCPEDEKISAAQQIKELKDEGYEIFDMVNPDNGDTLIMQQYFMVFLKSGPNRNQSPEEAQQLQAAHMEHLTRMYQEGYADISGPFGDEGDLRGITIYNVPTLKIADSLANLDPMVKAGRLAVEVKSWWAGKGYPLR
ncbi:YciI family protein [Jejudonia soesokkakensis]|uniref:YciI family protein n=1 Tax=Jejudonia soesokkakensis TaxID=1323432 RepID=A0ABW2MNC9_9FLAO